MFEGLILSENNHLTFKYRELKSTHTSMSEVRRVVREAERNHSQPDCV